MDLIVYAGVIAILLWIVIDLIRYKSVRLEMLRNFVNRIGNSSWLLKQGSKGLVLAIISIPVSFVPMFGPIAALVFSDLVLVSLAMIIAACLPTSPNKRTATAFLLWGVASVLLEAIRFPAFEPGAGLYHPKV